MRIEFRWALFTLLSALAAGRPVSAQGLESVGARAAAMAAFVAVADDASAVAWNPAGLVSGPLFNLQIDLGRAAQQPDTAPAPGAAASRRAGTLVALGTTPLGLAYYRLSTTSFTAATPAVVGSPDRHIGHVLVRTLDSSHLGATVQQSVGAYLTFGATLKLVRGSVASSTVEADSWSGAFDRADRLEREASTRGDVDAGAMFAAGQVRAGLVVRNVTAPSFGAEETGSRMRLEREARVGFAWGDRWPGLSNTVLSVDADVTRKSNANGQRRDVAAGAERWLAMRRVGVRGGVRVSTIGDARPVVSAGGSYAVRPGIYVDAFVARGTAGERGWGLAARVTY